jgi:putative membrane protein
MIKKQYLLLGLFILSCGRSGNDSKENAIQENSMKADSGTLRSDSKADADFAIFAADAGLAEVALGNLAMNKGKSTDTKAFAKSMVADHTAAGNELKALASQKNISIPQATSMDNQDTYTKLSQKNGADFDKEYADLMVSDHEKVVSKFQSEAESGNDTDLKQWASSKLPTLRHHLQMAQTLKESHK